MTISDSVQAGLTVLGRNTPRDVPRLLNAAANYLDTGRRLRDCQMAVPARSRDRFAVLRTAAAHLRTSAPIYLEFGVYRGDTMRFMASTLDASSATLIGFDSFAGLPEDWNQGARQGHFSTGGEQPSIDDERVSFEIGWFDETVPNFELPPHDRMLINIDCDLYSSASVVLAHLGPRISVGDLLYFDEFHDRLNEGKAFYEHISSTLFRYEVLAATRSLSEILFRRVA
jgi:hypothetical protein